MEKDTVKTVVVFRKFKDHGDLVALFPNEIVDDFGNCNSYQHVGQHGAAAYNGVVYKTVAATPEEYAPLKQELESIGYLLDVKKRYRTPKIPKVNSVEVLLEVNSAESV